MNKSTISAKSEILILEAVRSISSISPQIGGTDKLFTGPAKPPLFVHPRIDAL